MNKQNVPTKWKFVLKTGKIVHAKSKVFTGCENLYYRY